MATGFFITTFGFLVFEIAVLSYQTIFSTLKIKSKSGSDFIVITALFVVYNALQLLVSFGFGYISAFIGLIPALGILWYFYGKVISSESNKQTHRKVNAFQLVSGISIGTVFSTNLIFWSYSDYYIVLPLELITAGFIGTLFLIKTERQLYQFLFAGSALITATGLISILLYFAEIRVLHIIAANVFFIVIGIFHHMELFSALKMSVQKGSVEDNPGLVAALSKFNLTPRELEMSIFVICGEKYKDIAERQFVTYNSVTTIMSRAYKKIGIVSETTEKNEMQTKLIEMFKSYVNQ